MPVPDAPCTLLARIKRADASVFYCLLRPARAGALIRRNAPKRSALKRKIARQIHRDSPPQRRSMPFYKTSSYTTACVYMYFSLPKSMVSMDSPNSASSHLPDGL